MNNEIGNGNKIEKRNVTVYAFKAPEPAYVGPLYDSIQKGVSRFAYSCDDEGNVQKNPHKQPRNRFLLGIKVDDWIVHINVPQGRRCVAARVTETYSYDEGLKKGEGDTYAPIDLRSRFGIDVESIVEFDRNDDEIDPYISTRLNRRGRSWRVYDTEAFFQSIERVKSRTSIPKTERKGIHFLKKEIDTFLSEIEFFKGIAERIQRSHPVNKLELFVRDLFERIYGAERVKLNGGPGEHGADLLIQYGSVLPFGGIGEENTLVVQVKSYQGNIDSDRALDQIRTAIAHHHADSGLIVSTATATDQFKEKAEKLSDELNVPIGIIAGEEFARFAIKLRPDILISSL